MNDSPRALLKALFETAVAAAHPANCLVPHFPPAPGGRLFVLAAGKAAGSMTEVAESYYLDTAQMAGDRMRGIAVTRPGYGRPTRRLPLIEAGHPLPTEVGLEATQNVLALADQAQAGDLVLVLLSGGASANWIAPAHNLTLADKLALTRALLHSSASIAEINTLRKHLSRIKGGRLAARAWPAPVVTLAISDVPGDDPAIIGSGPTVPDPSTLAEARSIVQRYRLKVPAGIAHALGEPANETPKPGDPIFASTSLRLVARPADALHAAQDAAREMGYDCVVLGDRIEGEARSVAAEHARIAMELQAQARRTVVLSGGELTVTLRGKGRGGPNQEYALALAIALAGTKGITALAADTDGTDGGAGAADDPAGAYIDDSTLFRAREIGLDPAAFLADNDATGFFTRLEDLAAPGPTYTNVNDFRAILVDRH